MITKVKIPPERVVESHDVGSSPKPKKPRVKMERLKKEIRIHMDKLKNDLR